MHSVLVRGAYPTSTSLIFCRLRPPSGSKHSFHYFQDDNNGTPRNKVLGPGLRPDSKLNPGSSSVLSLGRSFVLSTDRRTRSESRTARNRASRSPAGCVKSSVASVRSHASMLHKVSTSSNTDSKTSAPGPSPTDSASRPQSRVSTTNEVQESIRWSFVSEQ